MRVKETENISDILKQSYFWDIDVNSGKPVSKRLVIERTFNLGTLSEAAFLIRHFGRDEVEAVLCKLNYIDPKTLNFISKFFGRPKKDFKCYSRKRLMLQRWDW